jgi:hypothetical protein
MPSSHGRQKKLAKQKKKRELARKANAARPKPSLEERVLRAAAALPFGPAFMSATWDDADADPPELVTIVITRRAPDGSVFPGIALVDRTCLGVKNAFIADPVPEPQLPALLARAGQGQGGMVQVDVDDALSVLFHAIDYARSLGFDLPADFPAPVFGRRPEPLRDTPLAKPARPFYAPGPDDDIDAVIRTLERAVGPGNFGLPPQRILDAMRSGNFGEALDAALIEDDLARGDDEDDDE